MLSRDQIWQMIHAAFRIAERGHLSLAMKRAQRRRIKRLGREGARNLAAASKPEGVL